MLVVRYIKAALAMLWLCFTPKAVAQQFVMRTLPTQEQMPMASIHCILQDREGYLWYGTEGGGLCRDDGYRIDVFRPSQTSDRQASCQVHCITEGPQERIYFGTSDGLYFVDKHDYSIQRTALDTTLHIIEALSTDHKGRVWVGAKGTIAAIDSAGNVCRYACQIEGRDASVACLYEDSEATIFAMLWPTGMHGEMPGILRKRKGEHDFTPLDWTLAAIPLQMLEDTFSFTTKEGKGKTYWVLTNGAGLVKMHIRGKQCLTELQPATMGNKNRNRGLSLLRDSRHGLLWTTTMDDLYAYRIEADGHLEPVSLAHLLPEGNKILDQLHESHDGSIYVSGYTPHTFTLTAEDNGFTRHTAPAIQRLTHYPLLVDRSVSEGRYVWIWQGRMGLVLYDSETDEAIPSPWSTGRTIQRCQKGGIWASHGNSVFRLYPKGGQLQREDVVECNGRVELLYEDTQNELWIATAGSLQRVSLISRQLKEIAKLPTKPLDMATDRQGNAYVALGPQGLYAISANGQLRRIDQTNESFLALSIAPDGTLWASTYEGNVYHYLPLKRELVSEDFLHSNNDVAIKDLHVDALGHVWTMTDQQVREYVPQAKSFRTIRNTDPVINVSYFYALEAIGSNRVGIDGAGALIEVESSDELSQSTVTDVRPRLSSIVVGNKTHLIGSGERTLTLEPDEHDITLQLTTLCHQHVTSVSFAYQLEGITRDWIYLPQGSSTIILSNLPKGSRQLRVMATDRYGCWGSAIDLLTLRRKPHWWETWWAYILYIGIAALAAYAIWRLERRIHLLRRLIRRRQEVRLDEIEMRRDDIAEQQRDDEFLRRVIAKTEENLSRDDYNVETLADDMCMSRITLYRHLQEQTGLSPSEFIRDIRLKKAAQLLLQSTDATIADIARKVGFATPKHFSRCFKQKFGVLPKDYSGTTAS